MPKKAILFISTELPYPPQSGGTIKSFKYIKDLEGRYDLSVACLLKGTDRENEKAFEAATNLKSYFGTAVNINVQDSTFLRVTLVPLV